MNKQLFFLSLFFMLISLACLSSTKVSEPTAPISRINLNGDLTAIDLCKAIPTEDIEAVMGRKLTSQPEQFAYYDEPSTNGCSYDAGKDSNGNAFFGYVVLTPIEVYGSQPLYKDTPVKGLGQEAYFNNGADARQLWVKVNDSTAFVIAFGDEPNESGALAIARLLLEAVK